MNAHIFHGSHNWLIQWSLAVGLIAACVGGSTPTLAVEVIDVVEQVSLESYTDYLQNDLYAHNGDSRYFGPQHDLARQNIQDRFESFGLETYLHPFDYSGSEYYNVVGVLPGLMRPREIYLVGANYDSMAGSPGACNNATSVALVMEAARVLSQYVFEATLVFIAFDRTQQGLIGSTAYANEHAHDDIRAAINIDSAGYRPYGPSQPEYNQVSFYFQSTFPEFLVGLAEEMEVYAGLTCTIARNPGQLVSDYVAFDQVGLPAAVFTSRAGDINPLIFTPQDSLDLTNYVDYEYATIMTQGLVGYLATVAGLEPVRTSPDLNGDWTVDIEDLTLLAQHWDQNDPAFDIAPPPTGDGIVDGQDLVALMDYWGCDIAEPGRLSRWKLDDVDGAIAVDSDGTSDGVLFGEPLWQPDNGRLGGAVQLDGENDYIQISGVQAPLDQAFSVFAWVKGGAPGQVIFSRQGNTEWLKADASAGLLMTELKSASRFAGPLCSLTPITDGQWHRVGLVWDGQNRTLYVDDLVVATDTQSSLPNSGDSFYIGAGSDLAAGSLWSGLIDDVRVYDQAVEP